MNVPTFRESVFREIDSSEKLELAFAFASYFEIPALLLSTDGDVLKFTPAVMEIFEACNPSLIIGDSSPDGFLEHIHEEVELHDFIFNGIKRDGVDIPAYEHTFENKAARIDARISRFAFADEILLTFTTQNIKSSTEIKRYDTLRLNDLKRQYTHTRSEVMTSSSHRHRNLDYQLSKAKKHLDDAQRLTGVGNFFYDLSNGEIWWSDQLYQIVGRDITEGPDHSILSLLRRIVSGDFKALKSLLRELREGAELTRDFKFRRYDDDKVIAVRILFSSLTVNSQLKKISAIVMDITLSDQFEHIERMYSLLMNNASDAIVIAGLDYKIQNWNNAAERLLGWSESEARGKTIRELCAPAYPDADEEKRKTDLANARHWKGTMQLKHKTGAERIVDATANPLINSDGHQIGYMAIYRDITDIYHMRKELDWREKLFDGFMARLPLMTFIKEKDDYVYANKEMIQLFQEVQPDYSIKATTKISEKFDVPARLKEKLTAGNELLLQSENEFFERNFDITVNEQQRHLKMIKFRLGNLDGTDYTGGLLIDLTDEMNYQRQLKTQKEKAESADKLKLNILQNLSHEFRTPLTGILGYASMVMGASTENSVLWGKRILVSAERLKQTLNNLLDFASLVSESYTPENSIFSIADLYTSLGKAYKEEAEKKDLHFLIGEPAADDMITSDFLLLSSAAKLVLDNAVKFTEQGTICLESSIQQRDNKDCFQLSIKDTGIGISKDQLLLIFNEFEQVSQGISRNYEGLGLGLTIAHKKISLLGGSIDIKSKPGKGTSVQIVVPVSFSLKIDNEQPESTVVDEAPKEGTARPKVLLVDDNEIIYDVFSMMLEDIIELSFAANGQDALALIEKVTYDLVLMDINLKSDLDGVGVLKEIRRGRQKSIPVIAVTGYAMLGDEQRFLDYGFNAYLSKPLSVDTVLQAVSNFVSVDY